MALLNKLFLTKKKNCKDNLLKENCRESEMRSVSSRYSVGELEQTFAMTSDDAGRGDTPRLPPPPGACDHQNTSSQIKRMENRGEYYECDWRGRKLLFDSSTVEQISINSEGGKKILAQEKNASKNGKREANHIYEISDEFIYQYKNAAPDARLLGEMIFGAVAMNYCGISLKIHTLDEPQRLMCTKVFGVPISRSSTTDRSGTDSAEQISRMTQEGSDTNMSTRSLSTPCTRLNLDDGVSLSLSFGKGDSGFYGDCSSNSSVGSSLEHGSLDNWDKDEHIHDDLFYYQAYPGSRKHSTCSSGSVQHRMHRNASTRLDYSAPHYLQFPAYGSSTRNPSYHSQIFTNSGSETSDSITSFGSAGSSGVQNKMKLGLALLITLTPDMEKEMLRVCTEHAPQLEALLYRLCAATDKRPLAKSLLQATQHTAQWLTDVLYGPPLPPVWLSLVSGAEQSRRHQADVFLQDLCAVLAIGDTKTTNFFMSTLITSVLTYHLGWVSTVSSHTRPRLDALNQHLPYNPLWAQLTDLRGALGRPTRSARTVLSGKDRHFLDKVLSVLTYFIRCGDVQQQNYQKTDFVQTLNWCDSNETSLNLSYPGNDFSNVKNNSDFNISDANNQSLVELSHSTTSSVNLNNSYHKLYECKNRKTSENNSVYLNNTNGHCMNLTETKNKFASENQLYSEEKVIKTKNKSCINLNNPLNNTSNDRKFKTNSEYFSVRKDKSISSCDDKICTQNVTLKRTNTYAKELQEINCNKLNINGSNEEIFIPRLNLDPKDSSHSPNKNYTTEIPFENTKRKGNSQDPVYKGLTKKTSVVNNCLLNIMQYNNESEKLDDSERDGSEHLNNSGVVFVLGDNEKLIGLKNKPTSSKSTDSLKSSQNAIIRKNDLNSIAVEKSSEKTIFTDSDSDLSRKSSPESIGDCNLAESTRCCLGQKKNHSKPVKHSGVKFEFDKYPQIVTNYMKSKNLELLNRDYLGKPGNLKLDGFSFDPTVIPPLPEENESCPKCRLVGLTLQTPSNASELEFTSDMPCHSQVQYAKEETVNDTSAETCDTPKTFIRKRKENTVIVNIPYTICKRADGHTDVLPVRKKSSRIAEQPKMEGELPTERDEGRSNHNMEVTQIPMPKSSGHMGAYPRHKSGYSHTLLKGVSDHYVPDLILQGTLAHPREWENRLRQELKMSVLLDKLSDANSNTQAVAIVADVDQWAVRVWGSSGAGGLSALVGNMLDSIPHMCHTRVPAVQCLSFIEARLRDICIISENLADVLMSTDFCDMATLTRALQLDANDVPLLLAVASTHTPQLAHRYGVTYR